MGGFLCMYVCVYSIETVAYYWITGLLNIIVGHEKNKCFVGILGQMFYVMLIWLDLKMNDFIPDPTLSTIKHDKIEK